MSIYPKLVDFSITKNIAPPEVLVEPTAPYEEPEQKTWYGKMAPSYCAPLTEAWFRGALTPHAHDDGDGTPLRALTPPRRHGIGPWVRVGLWGLAMVAVFGVFARWWTT